MGWDAFASVERDWENHTLIDPKLDADFKEASEEVKSLTGTVDGLLRMGGLDVSDCALMLEKATGLSAWSVDWDDWYVKETKSKSQLGF